MTRKIVLENNIMKLEQDGSTIFLTNKIKNKTQELNFSTEKDIDYAMTMAEYLQEIYFTRLGLDYNATQ